MGTSWRIGLFIGLAVLGGRASAFAQSQPGTGPATGTAPAPARSAATAARRPADPSFNRVTTSRRASAYGASAPPTGQAPRPRRVRWARMTRSDPTRPASARPIPGRRSARPGRRRLSRWPSSRARPLRTTIIPTCGPASTPTPTSRKHAGTARPAAARSWPAAWGGAGRSAPGDPRDATGETGVCLRLPACYDGQPLPRRNGRGPIEGRTKGVRQSGRNQENACAGLLERLTFALHTPDNPPDPPSQGGK